MSETAAPAPQAPRVSTATAWSLPARLMATFSGTTGFVVKLVLLGLVNAVAVWAGEVLATQHKWIPLVVLAAAVAAIDFLYLQKRALPAKFLIPGTIFLLAFTLIPIVYTVDISFTNYSTGHVLSKPQAITQIELTHYVSGKTYTQSPALDASGKLVLLLVDDTTGKPYLGTEHGLSPLAPSAVKISAGAITSATGYKLLSGKQLFSSASLNKQINAYKVPIPGNGVILPQGVDSAEQRTPTLRYDAKTDTFTNTKSHVVYRDNGKGSFASDTGPIENRALLPGWKTYIGFGNFSKILNDPLYRDPFVRVLIWTIAFAALTVLFSFALGLFVAIALQKKIRFQRGYRVILILPYAIPSFLTILVWGGLLDDKYGVVNGLIGHLGLHVPWLTADWWARVSVILVSVWLTFPYFFLVCLGSLQAIPGELTEAARVDGASSWQVFRKITLPLLLVAVAPLMIASFAFNFNNFNNIFLLTKGGPFTGANVAAGATDILISYTYKLAFATGTGEQYGIASALSIVIFFIVASISAIMFWRSRTLETLT